MSEGLPDGWKNFRQGEIVEFSNGRAYKLSEWEKEGTPVIRLQNLTGTGNEYYFSKLELPERQYCDYGDLLYMWSATFGPYIWKGQKAIYHYHIWKVICDEVNVTKRYLFQLLGQKTEEWMNKSNGMGILHVTKGGMEEINIPLPPLPEQKKIAKILSSVDEVIETTENQINKLKDLKKGLMNELLTKGIGHTEFKDSPVGRIPVGWEYVKLSAIVKTERAITYGIVQTGENIKNGIPCVRVVDLMKPNMPTSEMIKTSVEINNQYKRTILERGDILFALRGEIGCVRMVSSHLINANLTRGIALISSKNSCNSEYLLWALRSNNVRINILDGVNGSALQEIPLGNLRNIDVPIPDIQEQQKIASILTSIDTNIEQKQNKLTQSKNLKKSLMADLLTGRVRVKLNEHQESL